MIEKKGVIRINTETVSDMILLNSKLLENLVKAYKVQVVDMEGNRQYNFVFIDGVIKTVEFSKKA